MEQTVDQGAERVAIAPRKLTTRQAVDDFAEHEIGLVDSPRMVAGSAGRGHLWHRQIEQEKFSCPTASLISIFVPSRVPIVSAPFIANFMLPVPNASLPAVDICSLKSAAG
jgi:hypothetical protein